MQVLFIGRPFETEQALDKRRLNKQIIECRQILKAIKGESKAWVNHPCVKMYRSHERWLCKYQFSLEYYRTGRSNSARRWSEDADFIRPHFQNETFFSQMKRRLYTKDNVYYSQWANLGESDVNWYYVDGEWLYYRNGKRISLPQE